VIFPMFLSLSEGFLTTIRPTFSILHHNNNNNNNNDNNHFLSNTREHTLHQRRHVLQNPQVTTIDEHQDNNGNNDSPWWKSVIFPNADVATSTRPDFDILLKTTIGHEPPKPLVYLDSAATSHTPRQVTNDIAEYYETMHSNVHRGTHTLSRMATTAFEDARDTVASFVNAYSRNEVVFTSGATEAINLVASSYGRSMLQPGDEVVLTEMEHHSNIVPWQMIAQETGAILKFVKIDFEKGGLDLDHFESLLTAKTKLVGFQHVSNVMGCHNPVKDMVSMIRKKSPGARILLDACQSVPHMKIDIQDLGVDFLAASGHKMCGPTGIGFLWGREDLLNSMPPFMGGGEMIDQVTLEGSTFAPAPARFEAGTPPIAQAVGLASAIRYLERVGMDKIEAYEHEIASYMYQRLSQVDKVTVLGPPEGVKRAALCAFYVDGVHPSDLSTFLDIEGVAVRAGHHCCQPLHQAKDISHSARASLYIYNTKEYVLRGEGEEGGLRMIRRKTPY
jgi:cysteine desulfurase / selenocysteine lyase